MMAWFSVLIVTLTILSSPVFSRVLDRNFTPKANEDSVQVQLISLTNPSNFSSSTSFSSRFNFTIGNAVAMAIIPADFPSKFGTNMSFEVLDAHQFLGIKFYADVCEISYAGVTNVSKSSDVLKDGVTLSSWIEYQPISKWLEVRLSKLGDPKLVEPLISALVDLEASLKDEEVMLVLACSNDKHKQITSWGFQTKDYSNESSITRKDSRVQNSSKEIGVLLIIIIGWMLLMGVNFWCDEES